MAEEIGTRDHPVTPTGRIGHSFLRQRWPEFAVEFVLIIAGILAALYIDSWMQDRQELKLENAYLELLVDDLVQIEGQLLEHIAFEKSVVEVARAVLIAISDANLPVETGSLQQQLAEMSVRRTLQIESVAYADLTSTGNLQMIRNSDLRRKIVRYFADTERSELIAEKNSRYFVDETYHPFLMERGISVHMQNSSLAAIQETNELFRQEMGDSFTLPTDDILALPPDAESWDDIRRQVLFRGRIALTSRLLGERTVDATRELRAAIEAELQKPI